jgi:hypothetical protein
LFVAGSPDDLIFERMERNVYLARRHLQVAGHGFLYGKSDSQRLITKMCPFKATELGGRKYRTLRSARCGLGADLTAGS